MCIRDSTYPLATLHSNPRDITVGPDGNLWFVETSAGKVGTINPTTHQITEMTLPGAIGQLGGIVSSGGLLWVTGETATGGQLDSIDPGTKAVQAYPLPVGFEDPGILATGPDGLLYFTLAKPPAPHTTTYTLALGSFNMTTHVANITPAGTGLPFDDMIVGPDQQLWLTGAVSLEKFNVTTGVFTQFTTSKLLSSLVIGSDGNVWFTDEAGGVGSLDPTSLNVLSYGQASFVDALALTVGPDHQIWFDGGGGLGTVYTIAADQSLITGNVDEEFQYLPPGGRSYFGTRLQGQTVFFDLNHNGVLDSGEPSAVSDAGGTFYFTGIAPGNYTVVTQAYPGAAFDPASTQSQSVTVAAGASASLPNDIQVIRTSAVLPLSYSPTPFGSNNPDFRTAEVNGLYQSILGRAPDAAGLNAAVMGLENNSLTTGTIASNLLHSPEYYTDLAIRDYKNYLGRNITESELNAVVSSLENGLLPEALALGLLTSQEFNLINATNSAFAHAAYKDILGRDLSADEMTAVLTYLSSGGSRTALIDSLLTSQEAGTIAVNGLYVTLLSRPADIGGMPNALAAIAAGTPLSTIAVGLAASPEYQLLAIKTVGSGS